MVRDRDRVGVSRNGRVRMNVRIDHPTDRANFSIVEIGSTLLAFSYKTLIGVSVDYGPWILCENVWGPTTGKHLNYLAGKDNRIPYQEFETLIAGVEVKVEL